MMNFLLMLTFIFAIVDWYAVATKRRRLEYVMKPGTMLSLILWFTTSLPTAPPAFTSVFTLGLALSLIGDVFLMLPNDRFLSGVIAFLLAHVAYVIAYNMGGFLVTPLSGFLLLVIGVIGFFIARPIVRALQSSGKHKLVGPIIVYAVVLTATLWSTTTTVLRPEWPLLGAVITIIGGLLFYVSDSMNAWIRFVSPLPGGHLPVMITYHVAQFLMAAGVLIAVGVLG
ncbi:MAG: lysoplasmalogenase [Anaerolineales bacterium]